MAGLLAALAAVIIVSAVRAQDTSTPATLAGAWRLDDRNSDNADTVRGLLRDAARGEQAAPAPASSSASPGGAHGQGAGGHRGGGMGGHGGGMGGMGGGGAGGMGGGHGGRGGHGGGDRSDAGKGKDEGKDFRGDYPLPPTLANDGVLLVQQDAKGVQVRLSNGQQLDLRLDGVKRQTLSGNAMASAHGDGHAWQVSIQFADGGQLDQRWEPSADGKQLVVTGQWKAQGMSEAVVFRWVYVALQ